MNLNFVALIRSVMQLLKEILLQPSKELADQTFNQINMFMKFLDKPKVRTALVSGGVSVNENITALTKGVSFLHFD